MNNQRVIQIEFKEPIHKVKFLPLKLCIIAYHAVKAICNVHSYESEIMPDFRFTVRKNKIIKVKVLESQDETNK